MCSLQVVGCLLGLLALSAAQTFDEVASIKGGNSATQCPAVTFTHAVQPSSREGLFAIHFFNTAASERLVWVDVHYQLSSSRQDALTVPQNLRMSSVGSLLDRPQHFVSNDILLKDGDSIQYGFTYCSGAVDCDTARFEFKFEKSALQGRRERLLRQAEPIQCPAIEYSAEAERAEDGSVTLRFFNWGVFRAAWVDVHVRVNDGEQQNVRASRISNELGAQVFEVKGIAAADDATQRISYSWTYCLEPMRLDCDTEQFVAELSYRKKAGGEKSHKLIDALKEVQAQAQGQAQASSVKDVGSSSAKVDVSSSANADLQQQDVHIASSTIAQDAEKGVSNAHEQQKAEEDLTSISNSASIVASSAAVPSSSTSLSSSSSSDESASPVAASSSSRAAQGARRNANPLARFIHSRRAEDRVHRDRRIGPH